MRADHSYSAWFRLKSRKEQLSELEERVARLKAQLASVEKQSREIAQSVIVEEEQLRLALLNDPTPKEDVSFRVADGKRIKDYRFVYVGEETIDTPLGKVDTLHFELVLTAGQAVRIQGDRRAAR